MDERESLPLRVVSANRFRRGSGRVACEGRLMHAFAYGYAADMAEALAAGGASDTVFLAGGTELLNWLRLGSTKPARVIDIARLKGLTGVTRLPRGALRIGALTRLNDVALDDDVA